MTAEPRPDLEIATEATARELRFWRRPEVEIRVGERADLPPRVQLGHIHHHVRAAMRAMSRLTGRIGA
ncbi:MAG TPA: hypothetical protein VGO71_04820 [Baekduia sp.]|jgi:hypothetical protein|nr:hypothetical protein [Baekduia sp.]